MRRPGRQTSVLDHGLQVSVSEPVKSRFRTRNREQIGPAPLYLSEACTPGQNPVKGPETFGMVGRKGGSCGREAEGGGLLNRYTVEKPYRGFESLRLRQHILPFNINRLA
jgi:hypothetical protein